MSLSLKRRCEASGVSEELCFDVTILIRGDVLVYQSVHIEMSSCILVIFVYYCENVYINALTMSQTRDPTVC